MQCIPVYTLLYADLIAILYPETGDDIGTLDLYGIQDGINKMAKCANT